MIMVAMSEGPQLSPSEIVQTPGEADRHCGEVHVTRQAEVPGQLVYQGMICALAEGLLECVPDVVIA
jgi:hypothetical protein